MATLHGIDVSHAQGKISWPDVAANASDLRFVMSRMSHGGHGDDDLRIDTFAKRNLDGMRTAFPKTPRGYFHFLGSSTPKVQARHFHGVVGDLQPGEFLMLDAEPDEKAKVGFLSADHIVATLEAIEDVFGQTPWLYIGLPYLPTAKDQRLFRFPLHFPHYHPNDEKTVRKDADKHMLRQILVWQWGGDNEGARIKGIPPIDKKKDNRPPRIDSNQIIDEAGFVATLKPGLLTGGVVPPPPLPPPPPGTAFGFLPTVARGAESNAVFVLQCLLVQRGLFQDKDGNRDREFGGGTERRVTEFQAANGLPASGTVDATTWRMFAGGGPLGFVPEVARGAQGNPVFLLQGLLIAHGLFQDKKENRDGKFEGGTERRVGDFQRLRGLPATGKVDRATWAAFGTSA